MIVGYFRCGGFRELVFALGADAVGGTGQDAQCTVTGGIHKDPSRKVNLRFRGGLIADDAADILAVHHHILHRGIQVGGQVLLLICHFPHDRIENREGGIGIALLVLQQQFLQQAGFAHVIFGCVTVRADDMHSYFRAGIAAEHGPALYDCNFCALSSRRHRSEKACQTAACNDNVIIRS